MSIEDNNRIEPDIENFNQSKKPIEDQESTENELTNFKNEAVEYISEFKNKDNEIQQIEESVSLSNPELTDKVKQDLKITQTIANLNTQAELLKIETDQEIEWLKLDDHKFNEDNFYRVVDEKGYEDFKNTKVVRSSTTGTDSHMAGRIEIGHRPTPFPSFSKGKPDPSYMREGSNNYIFESDTPMFKVGEKNPVTNVKIKGSHYAHRPINQETGEVMLEMTPEMIKNIYRVNKEGELHLKKESTPE